MSNNGNPVVQIAQQINIQVSRTENGNVVIGFGGPIAGLELNSIHAVQLARQILMHAGASKCDVEFAQQPVVIRPTHRYGKPLN